jgi:hypothetical protein
MMCRFLHTRADSSLLPPTLSEFLHFSIMGAGELKGWHLVEQRQLLTFLSMWRMLLGYLWRSQTCPKTDLETD